MGIKLKGAISKFMGRQSLVTISQFIFVLLNKVFTSHFQFISKTISLHFSTNIVSPIFSFLAPSETMYKCVGSTFFISSNTFWVLSGRLKINNNIGVLNIYYRVFFKFLF